MEALSEFPQEYSKSFQSSFYFLNNFNVRYLEGDQPFLKKNWRFFYIVPSIVVHLISFTTHMTILVSNGEMIPVAYMLPSFLVCTHSIFKSLIIVPKTDEISTIISDLGHLWRTKYTKEQNDEKNEILKKINYCNRATYWITILGSVQYMSSPLVETVFRTFVFKQECEMLLPIAAAYPFNPTKNWFIYLAVYVFQVYVMFLFIFIYMGSNLLVVTLCALLGTEFMMLKDDLSQVKPVMNSDRRSEEYDEYSIEEFVKRHQKLIRLSRQLDNVFNRMIFIDLLYVGITTCAFSFAGEFARGPTYTLNNYVGVASSLLNVLYLCYYGEMLTRASARLADTAYQSLWYEGGTHFKKAIWLIIKISQNPCCLTSLRYAVVSLHLFTKVVSTTWSYFSLMNSVYTDEEK
ncbi:odorant receptor 13a-like [Anticarsia gemmatalis]|uniref:odorant receptor 13a-like n=1 Tax=Anticarsia gemmatalis TaxID=129554 RepID=UPI003F768F61